MTYSGDAGVALTADDTDELARAARDGDRDALEVLLTAVRPRVLNICRGVLPYSGDAEDACQEALLNVATKIGGVGRPRAASPRGCTSSRSTARARPTAG